MPDFSNLPPPSFMAAQARRSIALPTALPQASPGTQSPFAQALARANAARQKPYASPLKQAQAAQASQNQAKPRAMSTTSSTSLSPSLSTSKSTIGKTTSSKPAAPVARPEHAGAADASDPSLPMALSAYPHPNGDN